MNTIYLDLNGKMYCIMINVCQWVALPPVRYLKDSVQAYIGLVRNICQKAKCFTFWMIFFIVSQSAELDNQYLQTFLSICEGIGIPMAPDKTIGPVTCLTFLGIELDTVQQKARLPKDKIEKSLFMINDFLGRKKVNLKDLQSLCGLLNFACSVIVPGRAFLRRLFDLTRGLRKPYYRVRLRKGCKDDLKMWKNFLENFNGKCFFIDQVWISSDKLQLYRCVRELRLWGCFSTELVLWSVE